MLPFFKVLKGLIGNDVSHFVDFYGNCGLISGVISTADVKQ